MRIIAILAVRNEELYIGRCLRHLANQGINFCVIDNSSTDATVEIANSFKDKGLVTLINADYPGYYDWVGLLKMKEALSRELQADWFIHYDADEIREPPNPWDNLHQAIEAVDREGYNAIDFAEFVFVPISEYECFENGDYVKEMKYYYYFQPNPKHRVNAWKNTGSVIDLSSSGGHRVLFESQKIYPIQFILRHYIGLSAEHLLLKYGKRVFSTEEVKERRWHGWRAHFQENMFTLPLPEELKLVPKSGDWDKSDPKRQHIIIQGV